MKYRKNYILIIYVLILSLSFISCKNVSNKEKETQAVAVQETNATEISEDNTTAEDTKETLRPMPNWADTAIIYEVNVRQYTKEGTFDAFSQHLTRLKNMGITTLWFMPIYPISEKERKGSLGSYYAIADYKAINPEFGNMEDFKELVDKAHELGFTVMLDWVANHTGWDHVWIEEHPEYYKKDTKGNITFPVGTDWYDVAQLDYQNDDMRVAMIDAMRFWVEEADIDGFRCDYAGGVPLSFWETARKELSDIKNLYMLAEDNTHLDYLKYSFDSNYNWPLYEALCQLSNGERSAKSLQFSLEDLEYYPEGSFPLNFMDNHDKNSWEGSMMERFEKDSIPAMTTFLFTAEGAPLIYSGHEAALDHSLQFFEKDEIKWGKLPYEKLITRLSVIKKGNPALYNGSAGAKMEIIQADNSNILIFERVKDGKKVTAIFNMSGENQTDTVDYNINGEGTVLIHGDGSKLETKETKISNADIKALTSFAPWEFYVISSEE